MDLKSRRRFLGVTLGVAIITALLPRRTLGAASSGQPADPSWAADANAVDQAAPDDVDLEIAALGEAVKSADPGHARILAAAARASADFPPEHTLSWADAHFARELLTQREIIERELRDNKLIFVDGWPLAHSEAGAALLFAEALASSSRDMQGNGSR